MSDEQRIAEIEGRTEKTTPEPWRAGVTGNARVYGPDGGGPDIAGLVASFTRRKDSELIAHARTDIPWLINRLRLAIARAEKAEAALLAADELDSKNASEMEGLLAEIERLRAELAAAELKGQYFTEACARTVHALEGEIERLRKALASLRNEVNGILGVATLGLQDLLGNTNIAVLRQKIADADAALAPRPDAEVKP